MVFIEEVATRSLLHDVLALFFINLNFDVVSNLRMLTE